VAGNSRVGADHRTANQHGESHNNAYNITIHQNSPKHFGLLSCESLR
jgi:hypothetical protein